MSAMLRFTEQQVRDHVARIGSATVRTVRKLSVEDETPPIPAKAKYRNKKVQTEEATFASEKEYRRYQELKLLERGGNVRNLRLQVRFELAPACELYGKRSPAIRYFADFTYEEKAGDGWRYVVEDTKGFRTGAYIMKRHLMKTVHGITILET